MERGQARALTAFMTVMTRRSEAGKASGLPVRKGEIAFFEIKAARAVRWLTSCKATAVRSQQAPERSKTIEADLAVSIDAVGRTPHWRSVIKAVIGSIKLGGILIIEERFAPNLLSQLFPRMKMRASWGSFNVLCDDLGLDMVAYQRSGLVTHAVFIRTE